MGFYFGNSDAAYDHWLTTPPDDVVIHECYDCGNDIYEGEEFFEVNGDILCEECAEKWLKSCKKVATRNDYLC